MTKRMSTDPETHLTRIERALARIERAAQRTRDGDKRHGAQRTRTTAALAELDRVIARLGSEAR